jgi:4-amino-4-deoxy-L-arabinose transferase-like glycosyltransferase
VTRPGILMAIAVWVAILRLAYLGDYPDLHPDEGFWASGARNYVKFGSPLMDGRLHPFLSPGMFVGLSGFFSILEPSLWSARLFSAFAGLLSCVIVWRLGIRLFPQRPWLPLFLFGGSSLVVLINRTALLESFQMLWLLIAAWAWLSARRGSALMAGAAFGVALLVKSNSIYLLPAFFLSLPADRPAAKWTGLALVVVSTVLVAAGGYGVAWAIDPTAFHEAFRYELDGRHFMDEGVVFHIGRFGLHPRNAMKTVGSVMLSAPLLLPLALVGAVLVLRQWGATERADRFFTAWLLCGLAFTFSQIYIEYRYLTTLAPAFAILAARMLDRLLGPATAGQPIRWQRLAAVLVILFLGLFDSARVGAGIIRRRNDDYWQTVRWVSDHVDRDSKVLAAPYLGLSLPNRSYDFYRLLVPYREETAHASLAEVVDRLGLRVIVVETEWRAYETADTIRFLEEHCLLQTSFGKFTIYTIKPADPA